MNRDGHPLLHALTDTLRALERHDAIAACDALAPAVASLGADRLEPSDLAEARDLQRRCEAAAATLHAGLREQLDAFGRSRRARGAYRQA